MTLSRTALRRAALALAALGVLACGGGGTDGKTGAVDSADFAEFTDARVSCDPTADVWDDLFIFEADTYGDVFRVSVEVYEGSSLIGGVTLTERAAGDWYGESWADDLGSDCDNWGRMLFQFSGDVQGGHVIEATVEP